MVKVNSGCLTLTALVKLVDFQPVDFTELGRLAQLYFLAALRNDGWLSILRVGIPMHIDPSVNHKNDFIM